MNILSKILKNKKLKFLLPFLSTILLAFPGGFVQAASLGSRVGGFFISLIGLILYLFSLVANMLMRLGGGLLSRVITLTFNENLFIEAPFVKVTWGFTRDLANIFFIAWLVIIAIATIIDYKGYQAKKLLPRLIIVAILVNFSLVLCGIVLDLGQGVMGFLTQSAITIEGQPYGLAEGLVLAFNQSELFGATMPGLGSFFGGINAAVNVVMQNALVLVFASIAAYVFIILSVMMLVRVGALWLLLIFAPLAWVVGIMPFGKSLFEKWMSNFIKWAFYGVVVAFFLYLAAMAVWAIQESSWQESNFGATANMGGGRFGTNISFLENFSSLLSFMVVMILLLQAKSAGMKAAKSGGDMLTGAIGGYIGGKVATMGKKSRAWAGKKVSDKGAEYKDRAKGRVGGVIMDKMSTVPILGKQGAKMKVEAEKARQKRMDKHAYLGDLSEDDQLKMAPQLKGEALESLARKMMKDGRIHKLDKNDPGQLEALRRINEISQKPGNEEFRKDWESKRVDMITDSENLKVDTTQQLQAMTSNDPLALEQMEAVREDELRDRRKKAMEKARKDGSLKNEDFVGNLSDEDLKDFALDKDSAKVLTGAIGDFSEEVKQHVLDGLQSGFTEDFDETTGKDNMKLRSTYAKVSGNYHEAYALDPHSLNAMTENNRNTALNGNREALKLAVSKISGEKQWEAIKDDDDGHNMKIIAEHMQKSQVSNAGRFLDASTKEKIFERIKVRSHEDPDRAIAYEAMLKNDTWPGDLEKAKEMYDKEKEAEELNKNYHEHREANELNRNYREHEEADSLNRNYREHEEANASNDMFNKQKEAEELNRNYHEHGEANELNKNYHEHSEANDLNKEHNEKERKRIVKEVAAWNEAHREKEEREKNNENDEDNDNNGGGGNDTPPNEENKKEIQRERAYARYIEEEKEKKKKMDTMHGEALEMNKEKKKEGEDAKKAEQIRVGQDFANYIEGKAKKEKERLAEGEADRKAEEQRQLDEERRNEEKEEVERIRNDEIERQEELEREKERNIRREKAKTLLKERAKKRRKKAWNKEENNDEDDNEEDTPDLDNNNTPPIGGGGNNRGGGNGEMGGGGATTIQGGTINAESANINAVEVNIQTPEMPNTNTETPRANTPPVQPTNPSTIIQAEPLSQRKKTQTTEFLPYKLTPSQNRDFQESKKRRSAEGRQGIKSTPLKKSDIERQPEKVLSHETQEADRAIEGNILNQAKLGNLDDAMNSVNDITDSRIKDRVLGEIASKMMDEGKFDEALRAARKINYDKTRINSINEVERRAKDTEQRSE